MASPGIDSKKVLKFMFRESFKEKKLWLAVLIMPVSAFSLGTALPYLISDVIARLATQTTHNWTNKILVIILVATIGIIANRAAFYLLLTTQARSTERIHNNILRNLLQQSSSFYSNRMTGKLVSDGIGFDNAFIRFQDVVAINLFPFLVNVTAGIIIVATQSFLLGFGLIVLSITVVATAIHNSHKRAPLRYQRHEARRKLHGNFADVIINNQAVKMFAREAQEERSHAKLNHAFTIRRLHDWKLVTFDGNNRIIAVLILQILFVILLIHQITRDPSLLTAGIFAFSFTITLSNRMFEVSTLIRGIEDSTTDAYPMVNILGRQPDIVDAPGATKLTVKEGAIRFDNVLFKYADQRDQEHLFKALNLRIKAGEKVGLVGRSGSGKTTITKLLLRFVDIQGGKITIDGQDIAQVTQKSLRESIAYVPQEPLLFHRTLTENIAYGKPHASRAKIEEIAKQAHAHEFIKGLPDGYDTLVGERGVKLSGGQRQRVAIARAMLKNAPILVLDEATSALDSESEVLIQDALWKLMEGRTAIVIAHRLSTIQKMDRIIVLDNGKIIEEGTHKELLAKKGKYAELWSHQSGGFLEE